MSLLTSSGHEKLTMLQMVGLTCVMGGIQIIWAVLMGSTSVSCRIGIIAGQRLMI